MFSQGVPMLVAGDETGRTQAGNNNAWCQDNEISWLDWNLDERRRELLEFTRRLIQIFNAHPVLRRRKFFQGRPVRGAEIKDISWLRPDGREMTNEDWRNDQARSLAVLLAGDAIDEMDERGRRITDDTLLLLLNANHRGVSFTLPTPLRGAGWEQLLDTREGVGFRKSRRVVRGGGTYRLEARSLALFRLGAQPPHEETHRAEEAQEETVRAEETKPDVPRVAGDEAAMTEAQPTETVYCENAKMIVPLDEGFCRACSRHVEEGDQIHSRPTPEMLKQLPYFTTAELPEPEAQGEGAESEEEARGEDVGSKGEGAESEDEPQG